jgi:hypothetical protein
MGSFANAYLNRVYTRKRATFSATIKSQDALKQFQFLEAGGEAIVDRFQLAGARAISSQYASAQIVADGAGGVGGLVEGGEGSYYNWLIPQGTLTGSIVLDVKDMRRSRGKAEAEAKELDLAVKNGLGDHGQRISDYTFGPNGNYIGQTSGALFDKATIAGLGLASAANTAIALLDPTTSGNFHRGDVVLTAASDGSSGSAAQVGANATIEAVNHETGQIAFVSAPAAWATAQFIFRLGDLAATGGNTDLAATAIVFGMGAYLPASVSGTTIAGVNRQGHSLLSGLRPPATGPNAVSGLTIPARARRVCALGKRQAGWRFGEHGYVMIASPEDFDTCVSQEGFSAITVNTAVGTLTIIGEASKESGYAYLCPKDYLRMYSPGGEIASFMDEDGSILSRKPNSNKLELRPLSFLANAPGPIYKYGRFPTVG